MKTKLVGTFLLISIVSIIYFIVSQRTRSIVSGGQYIDLNLDGVKCVVAAFDIQPAWSFSTVVKSDPGKIERWKELVMVSQSDALKFLDNHEASSMYGRVNITDEIIEQQRNYAINRFKTRSDDLKVSRIYAVVVASAKTAHLIVPIIGPQGEYFTSLEWINGSWYLVPGIGETAWAVLNAKKILQASESQGIKMQPAEQIGPMMRELSATYLRR